MRPEKEKILRSHQVVHGQDLEELEINITEATDEGWRLYGPMQKELYQSYQGREGTTEYYYRYYQQMVKKDHISLSNLAKKRFDEEYGEGF